MSSPIQSSSTKTTVQGSVLAAKQNEGYNQKGTLGKDKRMWCERCKKLNHTKDMCWHIHGKPPYWKPRNKRKNNVYVAKSTIGATSQPFTAEHLEIIRKLMTSLLVTDVSITAPSSSTNPATLTSHKGIVSLLSYKDSHDTWIVDTGDSNHMTSSKIGFDNYQSCKKNVGIIVADGSMCTTTRRWDMKLNGLKLNSVLYVPNLLCNLFSVSKLTKDLNCSVTFLPFCCKFQDLSSKRTIGNAEV